MLYFTFSPRSLWWPHCVTKLPRLPNMLSSKRLQTTGCLEKDSSIPLIFCFLFLPFPGTNNLEGNAFFLDDSWGKFKCFFTEIDLNQLFTVLVIVLSYKQNKCISDDVKPIWKQVKSTLGQKTSSGNPCRKKCYCTFVVLLYYLIIFQFNVFAELNGIFVQFEIVQRCSWWFPVKKRFRQKGSVFSTVKNSPQSKLVTQSSFSRKGRIYILNMNSSLNPHQTNFDI